jgi:hypothetical protein
MPDLLAPGAADTLTLVFSFVSLGLPAPKAYVVQWTSPVPFWSKYTIEAKPAKRANFMWKIANCTVHNLPLGWFLCEGKFCAIFVLFGFVP